MEPGLVVVVGFTVDRPVTRAAVKCGFHHLPEHAPTGWLGCLGGTGGGAGKTPSILQYSRTAARSQDSLRDYSQI